jgi:hypothetical protein
MHGLFFQWSNSVEQIKPFKEVWQYPNESEHREIKLSPNENLHTLDGQSYEQSYFENSQLIILVDGDISLNSSNLSLNEALRSLANTFLTSGYQAVIKAIKAGSFNLVIFDKQLQELFFLNDFIGSIPLYYAQNQQNIVISSNPRAVFKTGVISKTIDMTGVASFVHLGYGFSSRHITKELNKLSANHCIKYSCNTKSIEVLKGNYNLFESFPQQHDYKKSNYSSLIKNACSRVAEHSGNTASFLSGGLDSRMVTAAWPSHNKLEHFTYGAEGSAEIEFAKMVAELNKAPLHHLVPQGNEITEALESIFEFSGLACFPERYYFAEIMAKQGFNSVNDGFLVDVFLGGDFYNNDSYLSKRSKIAKYFGVFIDQKTRNHSIEAIAQAYFDSANLVKNYNGLKQYLDPDFIAAIKLEKENIIEDIYNEVKRLSQYTESIAYIFRNITASNRSANYTLTQGVNARQFLKVNYPLGLDKDLTYKSLELAPKHAAYRRGQLKALQDNYMSYATIPYSRTLIPATYSATAHKWASILNGMNIHIPGFNYQYKNKDIQFSNWSQWFANTESLRELARTWLLSGGISTATKLDSFFNDVAKGKKLANGHIFHIAGISRWLADK